MEKATPLWREAHLEVRGVKTRQCRSTIMSCFVVHNINSNPGSIQRYLFVAYDDVQ